MPLFIAALAFLLPLAAYFLWRHFRPGETPSSWLLLAAVAAVVFVLGGALTYGLNRSIDAGQRYVPATLTPER